MLLEIAFIAQSLNECQDQVEPRLLIGLLTNNPYQITVMGADTVNQVETEGEATAVIKDLSMKGIKFNAGIMKIHSSQFEAAGLDNFNAFNTCDNINAGATLLASCIVDAGADTPDSINQAYACYKAKNFLPEMSKPMEINPADAQKYLNSNPENAPQAQPKKVEPWDVFADFTHN